MDDLIKAAALAVVGVLAVALNFHSTGSRSLQWASLLILWACLAGVVFFVGRYVFAGGV